MANGDVQLNMGKKTWVFNLEIPTCHVVPNMLLTTYILIYIDCHDICSSILIHILYYIYVMKYL